MFPGTNLHAPGMWACLNVEPCDMTLTCVRNRSDYEPTKYIPYLTLTGQLWGVFCEYLEKNVIRRLDCSYWNRWTNASLKYMLMCAINSLRPREDVRHFPDGIFKCILFNENVWILIKISLKFVPKGPINNIPTLVQIMTWRRTGDKPLSEPMMTQFTDAYMRHSASMS